MSAYWPPLENLPTFDVLVFRNAQDVVDYAIASGSTTAISLTSDNSVGTYWIPFSKTTSTTSNKLYIDNITTPLSYNPFTSTVTATNFNGIAGSFVTTQTTTQLYYLVGSISQGTSTDTTLYKSSNGQGIYVNPATNTLFSEELVVLNSNSNPFYISFFTPTSDDIVIFNNSYTVGIANNTFFYNLDSGGSQRTVLTLNGDVGASTFDGLSAKSTTVAVAVDNSATTMYPIFTSSGAGQKSLLFDTTTTPLSYVPSTSTLTASTFVGALTGLASQATTVAVADNNSATTMYPVFTTATAGQKSLLFDSTTTPLSYNPSTGDLAAVQFCCGILSPVAGNNAGFLAQNVGSSATVVQNQATSGFIHLGVRDAANALSNAIILSTSDLTITTTNSPVISARNVVVDNASGVPITIGNGASTATSNIIMTSGSLASTRDFTTGENVIIGNVAGNALVVASNRNTLVGDSAGSSATGNNNVCIGYNSQVPTAASSNQIAIGTATETMYIRGGFNYRVGTQITASINLSAVVLAQFYTVAMAAASQTITLPNPTTAAYLGAKVIFKRKTNTTAFNLAAGGTTPFLLIGSITLTASPVTFATTTFQAELVCDGTNWCIISQA